MLESIFPGSVFLDENYVVSSNHKPDSFCAFVDNILGHGRPSAFLRRPGQTFKATAASPFGAAETRADDVFIPALDFQHAIAQIVDSASKAADVIQDRYTGRLTTIRNAVLRYSTKLGALAGTVSEAQVNAIPSVPTISAKLSTIAGNMDSDNVVFDPQQPSAAAPLVRAADADAMRGSLPEFAKQRFGAGGDTTPFVQYLAGPGGAAGTGFFQYSEAAGGAASDDVKDAYTKIVRVLLNYTYELKYDAQIKEGDAKKISAAFANRAAVLAILTLVNDSPTKKKEKDGDLQKLVAARFLRIFSRVLEPAGVTPTPDVVSPNVDRFDLRNLVTAVNAYFTDKPDEASDTFGMGISGDGTRVQRTAATISATIGAVQRRAAGDEAAIKAFFDSLPDAAKAAAGTAYARGTAAGLPRYDAADYIRTDLRISPDMFKAIHSYVANVSDAGVQGVTRIPLVLPADPEDNDTLCGGARFRQFAVALQQGDPIPSSLAPHSARKRDLGSREVINVPAVANVRLLRHKGVLVATGQYGAGGAPPSALEASLRASENYGVNRRSDLIRYEGEQTDPTRRPASNPFRMQNPDDMEIVGAPAYFRPGVRQSYGAPSAVQCLDAALADDVAISNGFQELWDALDQQAQADNALAAVGKVFLGTPTKWRNWKALLDNNVIVPATVLLTRPLAVFETYSLYFLLAGSETLITRFGQPLSTWSNESQRQVYSLTLAFKSKTTCINERNIYHVPNGTHFLLLTTSLTCFSQRSSATSSAASTASSTLASPSRSLALRTCSAAHPSFPLPNPTSRALSKFFFFRF